MPKVQGIWECTRSCKFSQTPTEPVMQERSGHRLPGRRKEQVCVHYSTSIAHEHAPLALRAQDPADEGLLAGSSEPCF